MDREEAKTNDHEVEAGIGKTEEKKKTEEENTIGGEKKTEERTTKEEEITMTDTGTAQSDVTMGMKEEKTNRTETTIDGIDEREKKGMTAHAGVNGEIDEKTAGMTEGGEMRNGEKEAVMIKRIKMG